MNHVTLMPLYGLNVYSILKHESLVMTLAALEEAERKLLLNMRRIDAGKRDQEYKPPLVGRDRDPFMDLPTVETLHGDMYDLH